MMFLFRWILYLLCIFVSLSRRMCALTDTMSDGQLLLLNKSHSLVSKGGQFKLGFFAPPGSGQWYLGIWYANILYPPVVWVFNRNNPIPYYYSSRSRLEFVEGTLYLHSNSRTSLRIGFPNATEAVILDSGNFILRNASGVIWQSFDYPTDTLLPGGKVGYSRISGEIQLTSWKTQSDPALGTYSLGMDPEGGRDQIVMFTKTRSIWRSGVWQGERFASLSLPTNSNFRFERVPSNDAVYFRFHVSNESSFSRIELGYDGLIRFWVWMTDEWVLSHYFPNDYCQEYNPCGSNAVCDLMSSPACECLTGFVPVDAARWELGDFSEGCGRSVSPCSLRSGENGRASEIGVEYEKVPVARLPAHPGKLAVKKSESCESACSANCFCNAFVHSSMGGCLYFISLMNLQRVRDGSNGSDLYVKVISGTRALQQTGQGQGNKHVIPLALALSITAGMLIGCSLWCYLLRKCKRKDVKRASQDLLLLDMSLNAASEKPHTAVRVDTGEEKNNEYELPLFSFSSIAAATNNFSLSNKLGEGGFGPVYKGELLNEQFVAVKRLSRRSGQGLEEFRSEIELVAKLQHRNLVRILGCCVEQDEKILVYEYMPNKSLDFFLFDPNKPELSDWGIRAQIIEGIAQGLLYLHQYSRFRVVHRDIKASNILLDCDMKPKISDFGMARIFGGNKLQENTDRIVGTYGYMSPEYAMDGLFSVKSDVFAFGVLLLEIVSGKKNNKCYGSDNLGLIGHAWNLWKTDAAVELVDPRLGNPSSLSSAPLKYIHVGLLCVQVNPSDRPTMEEVVAMLNSEPAALASPQDPVFTVGRTLDNSSPGQGNFEALSVNGLTVSCMEAR